MPVSARHTGAAASLRPCPGQVCGPSAASGGKGPRSLPMPTPACFAQAHGVREERGEGWPAAGSPGLGGGAVVSGWLVPSWQPWTSSFWGSGGAQGSWRVVGRPSLRARLGSQGAAGPSRGPSACLGLGLAAPEWWAGALRPGGGGVGAAGQPQARPEGPGPPRQSACGKRRWEPVGLSLAEPRSAPVSPGPDPSAAPPPASPPAPSAAPG